MATAPAEAPPAADAQATAEAPPGGPYAASLDDIRAAARRIAPHAHVTPVLTCSSIDRLAGCSLHFKAEIFQKGGAFKFRGAFNAVQQLTDEAAARGVATHSSGNHAAALALAARMRGIPALIVVPRNAPACKLAAVKEYGGELLLCEPTMAAREAACDECAARTGATVVPPFDSPAVIAGQGTIALELLQQVPELDVVVVPVSGGGMLSGITLAAKALKPGITVVAAEPSGTQGDAADALRSKRAGRLLHDVPKPATIADGLQARLGRHTWPVVRDLVDDVVAVDDASIVAAMRLLFERMKLVVEPSGAAGLAAVLSPGFKEAVARARGGGEAGGGGGGYGDGGGRRLAVGVILCGGNVDFDARGFWRQDNWQPAQ